MNLSRKEKAGAFSAFAAYIAWQNVDAISALVMRLVTGVLEPKAGLLVFGIPIQFIMYAAFGLLMLIGILSLFGFRFRRNGKVKSAVEKRATDLHGQLEISGKIEELGAHVDKMGDNLLEAVNGIAADQSAMREEHREAVAELRLRDAALATHIKRVERKVA